MESDNMVSLVSYNLLMTTTFDFPIDEKNGKLDQEYEYKWDCDCSSDSSFNPFMPSTEVKIELKPDHGIVPYHIGIMKLQKLAETLKENENKSALTAHINKTFSNVAVVSIEEISFVEFRYTLTMKFFVEKEIKELEALGKATLEGILELFPFMNILDVQLKFYFDSLKKDFGEEAITKRGDTVCSGIALPLKKTMTPEEINKLEKYADIFNEPKRYKRIEEKLSKEIQKDTKSEPIMFLTEVSRKWAGDLKIFFAKQNYDVLFAPGVDPDSEYMGQMLAYPKNQFELLNHTIILKAGSEQHHPLEAFQTPPIDWIKNHLHGKGKTSVGGLTCPEIHQIFDMVLNINRSIRPILFTHLRKKNMESLEKNNGFITGSYHMPMLVGKKIDTTDPSTGKDIQKDVGKFVMGIHVYAARTKFQAFVNMMVKAEIEKGLDGESLRDRVVFMGDMNSVPPKPGFKFCKGRPGEDEFIEHRLRYFLDGSSSASEDERLLDENELNEMLFLYNKDLKQSLDFYPAETFPPLDHVYKKMYGEFAERTTRTEEFEGALDHIFASPTAVIKKVAKMPTIRELQESGRFFPSPPIDSHSLLEDEPSDHLLQRAMFDFGKEIK